MTSSSISETSKVCKLCETNGIPGFSNAHQNLLSLKNASNHQELRAHYFCLLFSSGLGQRGEESEGLQGFLPSDVNRELRRGSRLKCVYCKRKGATVGCARPQCKKSYHLPCGMENYSLQQFFDQYKSFCSGHRPIQKINKQWKVSDCGICNSRVPPPPSPTSIWAPCCGAIFHNNCIQEVALERKSTNFSCPVCKDIPSFVPEMENFGIYIPSNSTEHPKVKCSAHVCICQERKQEHRSFNEENTLWEIIECHICAKVGIHAKCGGLNDYLDPHWYCYKCRRIDGLSPSTDRVFNRSIIEVWGTATGKKKVQEKVIDLSSKQCSPVKSESKKESQQSRPQSEAKTEVKTTSDLMTLTLDEIIHKGLDEKLRETNYKSKIFPNLSLAGSQALSYANAIAQSSVTITPIPSPVFNVPAAKPDLKSRHKSQDSTASLGDSDYESAQESGIPSKMLKRSFDVAKPLNGFKDELNLPPPSVTISKTEPSTNGHFVSDQLQLQPSFIDQRIKSSITQFFRQPSEPN